VASCYDEAIHAYVNGTFSREKIKDWDMRLARVFNRGFWDGYYLGQRLGEWTDSYGSKASQRKTYAGKVTNYFDRISVVEVQVETGELHVGDSILFTGPTTGVMETTIRELRVNEIDCKTARKGDRCSFPVEQLIRRSDKVYILETRS
jgi:putative protease